jgi:orotidine-5'-phosphate decarboxylase
MTQTTVPARHRLIVALDLPSTGEAEALADAVGDAAGVFKIGHQLAYTGGLDLARRLVADGRSVFLDLKLHDIPRTVEEGVRSLAGFGAAFLTVHAYPQTMQAAVAGRGGSSLQLLAVTVLTSSDDADLAQAGYAEGVAATVDRRIAQARNAGVDGIVCSGAEAPRARAVVGGALALVIPGIRPAGSDAGDQKRVMTPAAAIAAGADYLVVGRPITGAADPAAAARAIVAEIESAAGTRS